MKHTNHESFYFLIYGGTFRWTETKDKILLGEVRVVEPYQFKAGSKESGQGSRHKISCFLVILPNG